jgi:signal transduction histidine kinase
MKTTMLGYIKSKWLGISFYVGTLLILIITFYLYELPIESVMYGFSLSFILISVLGSIDFHKYNEKHKFINHLKNSIDVSISDLPIANQLIEEDYQELLRILYSEKSNLLNQQEDKYVEMMDYYTMWAHQIKTPLSALKLLVQAEDRLENKDLLTEIFKIEQYVDMVLQYLRMEGMSKDLVLETYELDNMVKQAVRKYATLFIHKKIKLELEELHCRVLTDEKWMVFVIEQILSNGIKYNKLSGTIKIYMDENMPSTLVIEDNGIGIKEEDVPRVFEKGFTGLNGRFDKKSTGIGLYLCKNIVTKLSHKITIESKVLEGTKVKIDFSMIDLEVE